jgi:hypothetical protein
VSVVVKGRGRNISRASHEIYYLSTPILEFLDPPLKGTAIASFQVYSYTSWLRVRTTTRSADLACMCYYYAIACNRILVITLYRTSSVAAALA